MANFLLTKASNKYCTLLHCFLQCVTFINDCVILMIFLIFCDIGHVQGYNTHFSLKLASFTLQHSLQRTLNYLLFSFK